MIITHLNTQTLGVLPVNPSSSPLVELMANYFLQTLQRNIFAYYYDRVTCQKRKTCFVHFNLLNFLNGIIHPSFWCCPL